jgi:hypothetical protein
LVHIAQQAGYEIPKKQSKPAQPTTPGRSSFVMPAPNYAALDEAVTVQPMDEAVPVQPMDEAVPVQPMDEAVPVQPMDDSENDQGEALQLLRKFWQQSAATTKADSEASERRWNEGVRWAKQIRQRGTSKNAVPYYERQAARQ